MIEVRRSHIEKPTGHHGCVVFLWTFLYETWNFWDNPHMYTEMDVTGDTKHSNFMLLKSYDKAN